MGKMTEEQFKALSEDVKPVVDELEKILEKHGVEKLATLSVNKYGWFRFFVCEAEYEYMRSYRSEEPEITDFREL